MKINQKDERKKEAANKRAVKITLYGGLLLVLIFAILFLLNRCSDQGDVPPGPSNKPGGVVIGTIDDDQVEAGDKDIQTLLNEQVAAGMFRVFISTHIEVDEEGNFQPMIQNVGRNRHHCWVELLDENGVSIYSSDVLPPGYKVETDTMSPLAAKGAQKCEAVFHLLDGDTKESEEVNSVVVEVDLVQN